MAEQLEIMDVRVGAPRASRSNPNQQRLDVAIDVRNNSNSTLHAITSVRSLDYDPSTQTLYVGLSEPEPQPGFKPSNFVAPHTKAVAPRETETIEVSVPTLINKVIPSSGLSLNVEKLDLTGVRNVTCEVAFATTPFYPKKSDAPEVMSRQLHTWGQRSRKTVGPSGEGESGKRKRHPKKS